MLTANNSDLFQRLIYGQKSWFMHQVHMNRSSAHIAANTAFM